VDFGLSEQQRAIEELFSAFFAKESPPEVARAAEPLGFDRSLWDRLATTGAPGMGAAEQHGGGGATLSDLVVVTEALGRAIAPLPLVEHLVASRLFPAADVLSGEAIATVSLRPAGPDGTWWLVPGGAVADVVVGMHGGELVAVRSAPPMASPANHACAPLASRSATRGDRTVLAAAPDFDAVLAEWKVLTASALVGVAAAALDLAVDYVNARHQFGVPIGSFQAVQHGLAELPGPIDGARFLTAKAAWAADRGLRGGLDVGMNDVTDALALASMAFVFAADTAAHATDRSLHYHGGYGFSSEYDIQLYYRRARGWALVLDDPSNECRRLADRLWPAAPQGHREED
jgi:alkylation response protein AidB-like acyl-CoA dehydrogenase